MKIKVKEITFSTSKEIEIVDITNEAEKFVKESKIKNGLLLIFAPHATLAIVANENESNLKEDMKRWIRETFSYNKKEKWKHNTIDNNAQAHLASLALGQSKVFPIINGNLIRGTWQNILAIELDGPRSYRRIILQAIGD